MPIFSQIESGDGSGNRASVTNRKQLVVGPAEFSSSFQNNIILVDTSFNFIGPKSDKAFIITDILLAGDRNIGVNDASVQIYEADGADETTVTKCILNANIIKSTSRDLVGLNLRVTKGKWLNGKTDDNNVFVTIMGYFIND